MNLPPEVEAAAAVYLVDPKTRPARLAFLRGMLQGMTVAPVPVEVLVRGVEDMAVAGVEFRPVVVRAWVGRAAKLIEGEAGRRAAESSVLRQPDAKQSGWSEDEVEA